MRGKILAGALMALAFLIPATPAAAETPPLGLDESCQMVERKGVQGHPRAHHH